MELENLKTAWTSVDERLEKKEILNTEMIEKMLKKKSNKSLRKLKVWGLVSYIFGFLFVIYIWFPLLRDLCFGDIYLIIGGVLVILVTIIFVAMIAISISAFKHLLKIDFSENIKDNIYYVSQYNLLYRKGKRVGNLLAITILPFFVIIFLRHPVDYDYNYAMFAIFVIFISAMIGVAYLIRSIINKFVYDKNIQTIKESLAELSELEEN